MRRPEHVLRRQVLGALACGGCGRERAEADDKATWTIVIVGGVLTEVLCPRCERRVA